MNNVEYYNKNAQEFYAETVNLQMHERYRPFLERIPAGGSILDAGCGSGRDPGNFSIWAIGSLRLTLHRRWCVSRPN